MKGNNQPTNETESIWSKFWKKFSESFWFVILSGLFSGFFSLFIQALLYSKENNLNYWESIFRLQFEKYNFLALIIFLILFAVSIFYWMFQNNKKNVNTLIGKTRDISNNIDKYLTQSKIIFESGINDFNDEHLLALHRILSSLNEKESSLENGTRLNIYAIDNSEPRTWWSDTMTGYLALLANWKSLDNQNTRRNVHRIFVCQKNELLSPVFAKTISLHSLMGFKTYVISYPMYKKILLSEKAPSYIEKEVLIWAKRDSANLENASFEIDFSLDENNSSKIWSSVKCYQSFWKINQDYNYRNALIEKKIIEKIPNYYMDEKDSEKIRIWFEFIAKEKDDKNAEKLKKWEELPKVYLNIIEKLISKMECCKDGDEVKHIDTKQPFGIEIKTISCNDECSKNSFCHHKINNGRNFDYTSATNVRNILKEYYYKLN